MAAVNERVMKSLKPWWGWVTLLPSPVDEEQLVSGLIVPIEYEGSDGLTRGVVVEVHPGYDDWGLRPGMVAYFSPGESYKIGDLSLVKIEDVVAFEEAR